MRDPKLVAASAIALAVTLFALFSMRTWAKKIGLVDRPSSRKHHRGSIPLIGGLCFFLGTLVGLSYLGYLDGFVTALLAGSVLIVAAGALDDASDLSVASRLLIEAGACGLVIFMSGFYVHDLGEIIGTRHIDIGLFGIPFTIIAVIGLINAFNMMDGIDGLAASMAMVCIVAIGMFDDSGWSVPGVLVMLQVLFAALVPYLFVNMGWPDGRKVFMGDAGSTLIGFLLAWGLVYMSHAKVGRLAPPDVLWCVALPVMDTLAVMYRRIRMGSSPFRADRQHLHHLLLDTGMPSRLVLLCMVVAACALMLLGYGLRNAPQSLGLAAFVLLMALHVWWVPRMLVRLRGRWPAREPRPAPVASPLQSAPNHGISFLSALARFDDEDDERSYNASHRVGVALAAGPRAGNPSPDDEGPVVPVRALCVLSDSPDAVQVAPIAQQLVRDERFETTLCVASEAEQETPTVLHLFDLSADVQLDMPAGDDHMEVTSGALGGMRQVMDQVQPDLVVVPGDAPATLAATLAAHYHQVPVVCIDGGLPTDDAATAVDDPGRRIARTLASLHVASDQSTGRQLVAEGVPAHRVIVSGNSGLVTLHGALQRLQPGADLGREFAERYAFLREGAPLALMLPLDAEDGHATPLLDALYVAATQRPAMDLVCVAGRASHRSRADNVHLIEPPDYLAAVFLLCRAQIAHVAPGLYAEACAMHVPLLALEPLHLPEGVRPQVHLLGGGTDAMVEHLLRLVDERAVAPSTPASMAERETLPGFPDGAAIRIVDALAGLRSAAHSSTLSRGAGSPNLAGVGRAWEVS
ncbi:UDP-N-acetylglucosamine 2-epimerase [Lysobacter sp. LF1]|uniref:UDP-N-acetylglucosamine 2-epimerase n=1 Tax=Lysobacter stagni TaxID=3045172 RepID=A0ABT6XJK7_9GAMM|nr:UDP-N-acetylglucosamine 2-epimerase [Lysobacter sp. LF1]MDI9240248.1 UDP-N-acetylglucosamine 2-epimerase [Lysobacter sp. LF1]